MHKMTVAAVAAMMLAGCAGPKWTAKTGTAGPSLEHEALYVAGVRLSDDPEVDCPGGLAVVRPHTSWAWPRGMLGGLLAAVIVERLASGDPWTTAGGALALVGVTFERRTYRYRCAPTPARPPATTGVGESARVPSVGPAVTVPGASSPTPSALARPPARP